MRFRYLYTAVFVALLLFPLIIFLLIEQNENRETFVAISGVASFLFGLLGTYTLKDRQARLDKIVENASIERGELVFMADAMQVYPKEAQQRVLKRMDDYLMSELDLEVHYFYMTDKYFKALTKEIIDLKIEKEKEKRIYDRLLMSVEKIEDTRKFSATLFEDRVTKTEWVVLYFLILLIYISLLFANTGGFIAFVIIVSLACVISYLLVVAIKFDRMQWKVDEKIFEPYQQTFESLGLLRYYPKTVLDKGEIHHINEKPSGTKYRVGDTPNYPDISDRHIEIRTVK